MAMRVASTQLQSAAVHSLSRVPSASARVPTVARSFVAAVKTAPRLRRRTAFQAPIGAARHTVVAMAAASSIYDLSAQDIDGSNVDLASYKGKVLLVVNVASQCGFTKQYTGLQELQAKYNQKGFELLAFPCNQFGGQEPGSNDQIKAFAENKGATFKLFDKVDVNGDKASPVWKYLKEQQGGFLTSDIKWNFSKFLVDKNGKVAKRYASTATPEEIDADIAALL
mmetsp:Transcript_5388/g.15428  ORF Transcript_5388/g.15428 Transcript_5388/m.15428 type:complete len:225 (-) Transcript_5388:258-932(-)|eukprot:CAMPEP_0206145598 /NCGR_PEP_ID=MMETSP1473-20131121/27892_1 /ASSEMBLY_ACC=CAM_ASM_001109 /TAXON_ID=1461547 /ORGANISM="Stichococcus sp, Strain RCC1054" /LENGTH=224 /DNA_ID=CAMNT_0053541867 /DNA_START=71 /DNA_END=745 /DNA_ORIENTATION=-